MTAKPRRQGAPRVERYRHEAWEFEVIDAGPADAETVILLHGFPAERHGWDGVAHGLNAAGYRTLAPLQRGYSPGARPTERRAYTINRLAGDILALADVAGVTRFHVVGHDWGAAVAWHLAASAPDRVATLTALSVPHPGAMARAMWSGGQARRSWYMAAFQVPVLPELLLGGQGGAVLAWVLRRTGLDAAASAQHAKAVSGRARLHGPLGWYRAISLNRTTPTRRVQVPTLMMWAPGDRFIGRAAAVGAADWVAGPYQFVEVADGDHWLPVNHPEVVVGSIVAHLQAHPADAAT